MSGHHPALGPRTKAAPRCFLHPFGLGSGRCLKWRWDVPAALPPPAPRGGTRRPRAGGGHERGPAPFLPPPEASRRGDASGGSAGPGPGGAASGRPRLPQRRAAEPPARGRRGPAPSLGARGGAPGLRHLGGAPARPPAAISLRGIPRSPRRRARPPRVTGLEKAAAGPHPSPASFPFPALAPQREASERCHCLANGAVGSL